jgi:hypothetical protein
MYSRSQGSHCGYAYILVYVCWTGLHGIFEPARAWLSQTSKEMKEKDKPESTTSSETQGQRDTSTNRGTKKPVKKEPGVYRPPKG